MRSHADDAQQPLHLGESGINTHRKRTCSKASAHGGRQRAAPHPAVLLDVCLAAGAQVEVQPPVAEPPLLLLHELAAALGREVHLPHRIADIAKRHDEQTR